MGGADLGQELRGVIPVLVTPFDEGDGIDVPALDREVEFLLSVGVRAAALGFGSEIHRLTERERDHLLEAVVSASSGRLVIVGNVAAGSAPAAAERAHIAAQLGADAIMMPGPSLAQPTPEQLVEYFGAAAEASGIAVVVQDDPGVTGVEMGPATLAQISSEVPGVRAVKAEGLPSPPRVAALREQLPAGVAVLGGNGGLDLLAELDRGLHGTMPGPAYLDLMLAVWESYLASRRADARCLFRRLMPLLMLANRSMDIFVWVQKTVLHRQGVLPNIRQRTLSGIPDARTCREFEELLAELG